MTDISDKQDSYYDKGVRTIRLGRAYITWDTRNQMACLVTSSDEDYTIDELTSWLDALDYVRKTYGVRVEDMP